MQIVNAKRCEKYLMFFAVYTSIHIYLDELKLHTTETKSDFSNIKLLNKCLSCSIMFHFLYNIIDCFPYYSYIILMQLLIVAPFVITSVLTFVQLVDP